MTTDAKPKQISLRMLLVVVTAASVVLALYAALRDIFYVAAVLWVIANVACVCLSIYGFVIRGSQTEEWRRELRRYAMVGLLGPIVVVTSVCFVLDEVALNGPLSWKAKLLGSVMMVMALVPCIIIVYIRCGIIVDIGYNWDPQLIQTSKLLWWLRFLVLTKVTLLMVAIMWLVLQPIAHPA